jgi:hypothetical protein
MATYNGREVQIVNHLPATDPDRVLIKYTDSGSTEIVSKGAVDWTADEIRKQSDDEKKQADRRVKEHEERAKAKEDRAKLEADYRKEVEAARQKGLPHNVWLKSGVYNKGDQVTVDGVLYRSRMNDNQGNAPSDKEDSGWHRVNQPITNEVPQVDNTTKVPLGKPVVIGEEGNKPVIQTNTL